MTKTVDSIQRNRDLSDERCLLRKIIFLLATLALLGAKAHKGKRHHAAFKPIERPEPVAEESFDQILKSYQFIADFNEKPPERAISGEIFWRYPFRLAPQKFPLILEKGNLDAMIFRVPGEGRLAEHFAKGRVEYLAGNYDSAHATWLSARQTFDKDPLTNKRLEFFLAVTAAQVLREQWTLRKGNLADPELRRMINRLGYFLSSAFILRRDTADLLIDKHAPWGLYNLSATYFMIERWSLVFGSTEEGLSVLLKQGRKEFRPQFHQMNAEMHLKNHDILSAIQELDTGIRQDPNPDEAARMLYRVGDIYYGLNNFELAEEVYGTAVKIDKAQTQFNPTQTLLTGESAFWLGNFERARQLMAAALEAAISTDRDWLTESKALPWLRLRIADTWLAQLENAKLSERAKIAEETRFAYYKVEFEHPHTEAARIAEVRGACLELPTYEGKNVRHAREVLESVKVKKDVPEVLVELVEACLVGSYTERDRTPEMVAKVLEFSKKYPNSKFIERMIGPVRAVQAGNINAYFEKGYLFSATEFFEKRRKTLYPVVSEALSRSLFEAYVDTSRSSKAIEFWPRIGLFGKTEEEKLRIAAFLSEVIGVSLPGKKSVADSNYVKQLRQVVADLEQLKWKAEPSKYTQAMVSRLLNGPRSKDHVLWIGRGAEVWAKNDPDAQCGVLYPIVSRISEQRQDKESRKFVRSKLDDIFPDEWSDIETNNPGCAQAWLDLEAKNYTLAERSIRYASRADWRLFGPWLERIWTHSEDLEKSGQRGNAIKVWEKIANQAPKESFEARMAKTRLQPRQTEVEALWW